MHFVMDFSTNRRTYRRPLCHRATSTSDLGVVAVPVVAVVLGVIGGVGIVRALFVFEGRVYVVLVAGVSAAVLVVRDVGVVSLASSLLVFV